MCDFIPLFIFFNHPSAPFKHPTKSSLFSLQKMAGGVSIFFDLTKEAFPYQTSGSPWFFGKSTNILSLWCLLHLCFSSKNIIIMTKMTGIVMMMVIKMSLAWGQDLKVERTELFDQFNLKSHLFDCLQYSISTYSTSRTWSYQPGSTENWSLILFLVTIYWMAFKVPLFYL